MTCVYNQFKLNIAGAIKNVDATYNNFEAITGRKPVTWRQFTQKHQQLIKYPTLINTTMQ
jgi:NAD(P)H dehydrogenase (quinone)